MEEEKRILITGGAGFIGTHTAMACQKAGHSVCVYDTQKPTENFPRGVQFVCGSINDVSSLDKVFSDFEPTHVIHLAAQTSVDFSLKHPYHVADVNIMGTLLVIKCVKEYGCHLIFASSAGVYADPVYSGPVNEFYKTEPKNPYAVSKLSGELYIRSLLKNNHTIFRYSNVYGPGANGGVIKKFIKDIKDGNELIVREGIRDYIYVDDVVSANLLAIEKNLTGTFNVSTSVGTPTPCLIQHMVEILNTKAVYDTKPLLSGEMKCSVLNNWLLTTHDWHPTISLDEGLRKTIEGYSN